MKINTVEALYSTRSENMSFLFLDGLYCSLVLSEKSVELVDMQIRDLDSATCRAELKWAPPCTKGRRRSAKTPASEDLSYTRFPSPGLEHILAWRPGSTTGKMRSTLEYGRVRLWRSMSRRSHVSKQMTDRILPGGLFTLQIYLVSTFHLNYSTRSHQLCSI